MLRKAGEVGRYLPEQVREQDAEARTAVQPELPGGSKLNILMEGVANLSTPRGRQSGREDEGRGVVVQLWLGLD